MNGHLLAHKGSAGGYSVGYDVYDLFDLGEFDQKGSVANKCGDRAALERVAHALEANGIGVIYDVALHYRFHDASKAGAGYDLRTLFDGTLVGTMPEHAVTRVANHDTQPLQSLEAPVEPWFKPLAYALILLREQGVPCVFHPDLYGATYTDKGGDGEDHQIDMPAITCLPRLVEARKRFAYQWREC